MIILLLIVVNDLFVHVSGHVMSSRKVHYLQQSTKPKQRSQNRFKTNDQTTVTAAQIGITLSFIISVLMVSEHFPVIYKPLIDSVSSIC
jgi:CBS domain containing-hemolysin-like protein